MKRMRSYLMSAMGGACLALFPACKADTADAPQSSAKGYREQGLGDYGRLTQAEFKTYLADQNYIHTLVPPDVRVRLNMADPQQWRFAMTRLKLAGKTPENSPYLFKAMEERRQLHLSRGLRAGLLPAQDMELQAGQAAREMHIIEQASLRTSSSSTVGAGAASSTFPGGAYYTYIDTSYSDSSNYPLGALSYNEEYDGGQNVTNGAEGDLSRTQLKRYRVASYKLEDATSGFKDSYVYTDFGSLSELYDAKLPQLATPVVQAPIDRVLGDNVVSVCVNRAWTNDCDYQIPGTYWEMKLPLKGSVRISNDHVFDEVKIGRIKTGVLNGTAKPEEVGHIKIFLANAGGGCDVTAGNSMSLPMNQFWSRVSLSADKKTLSWDLMDNYAAFFDSGCAQVQDQVKLTMFLKLPTINIFRHMYEAPLTLSNDPSVSRPDYAFKKITVTNSCLAAGTEIALGEGKSAAIETVKQGDRVVNPYQPTLTVMDTAVGDEAQPMVRIRDAADRTLLMTEMHPIQVQARALKEGDVVMTRTGPSKLVSVRREAYVGKVYNLKVGSNQEKASLGEDQTAVYANGFLVGDGQIQRKYEAIAQSHKEGTLLARLPAKWHRDYQLSGKRQ